MGHHEPQGPTSTAKIVINGRPLADSLMVQLDDLSVDQDMHVPDMASLRFRDHERALADGAIVIGDELEVKTAKRGGKPKTLIFKGEVTAIEGQYDTTGNFVVIRAYDLEHRLHRGRRTMTYHNVKDSDLAKRVASEAGLRNGDIVDSRIVHEQVSRTNQSGFDFLRARAGEVGFELDVTDGKLNFRPAHSGEGSSIVLDLTQNLESFYPRLSAAEQVAEVEVRSWDPATKKPIVERTNSETRAASLRDTGADVTSKLPEERLVEVGRPLATAAEASAVARSVADQLACAFAQADGLAFGDPALRAGSTVEIANVGKRFDGEYTLTSCRHRLVGGIYRTSFTISGRQHRSLLGLVSLGESNRLYERPRVNGVVIGEVTDIADPEDLGRVKVRLPWLSDDYESTWARLSQLGAGDRRGMFFVPEVGDEVLLAFEHGDIRSPYILGGLYNGVDKPAQSGAVNGNGSVNHRSITSRLGHKVVLSDEQGKEEIHIASGDDQVRITLSQADTAITISSEGDVVIEGARNVSIEAGADLTLKAAQNLDIEAGSKLTMQSRAGTTMGSDAVTEVNGSMVRLN